MKLRYYITPTIYTIIVGYTFFFGNDLAAKITVFIGLVLVLYILAYALEKQEEKSG